MGGSKNSGGLGSHGTPTTLTKLLDLDNYHKCHMLVLGIGTPRSPLPAAAPETATGMEMVVMVKCFGSDAVL